MVRQDGCFYCQKWEREVADVYPKTAEGKAAPLERIELRGEWPEDLLISPTPVFTPTFILMKDGDEVSRIEGYPGEDFFWGLLDMALKEAGVDVSSSP